MRGINAAQCPVKRQRRQIERHRELLRQDQLKHIAGEDIFLSFLYDGAEFRLGHVGTGLAELAGLIAGIVGQALVEIIEHFGQTAQARLVGPIRGNPINLPDRRDHGHQIFDGIENGDDGRAQELAVGHVQAFGICIGNVFGQAHRVIAQIAKQPGRHGRQSGR